MGAGWGGGPTGGYLDHSSMLANSTIVLGDGSDTKEEGMTYTQVYVFYAES